MKKITLIAATLLLISGIFSCSMKIPSKDELSTWNIDISVPLIETSVTLNDLLEDSLITKIPVDGNGDSIFVFRDTMDIDSTLVGDQLELDPIHESFIQNVNEVSIDSTSKSFSTTYDTVGIDDVLDTITSEIGLIELSNLEPDTTEPFLFREIMPDSVVQVIEAELNNQGGQADVVIDTTELVPRIKTFRFETFRDAYIEQGTIQIKVINQMFIALGAPVTISLMDSLDNLIDQVVFDTEIPPGLNDNREVNLAGKHLPGTLHIEVSGWSNGTDGQQVQVTNASLDSYFKIIIIPANIQVTEAEAQVPSQTISDTSEIQLAENETKVHRARLMTAYLNIDMNNLMPVTGAITLKIPSLRSATDQPYQLTLNLISGDQQYSEDLSGWEMEMPLDNQQINYNYEIITDDTDPDFVTINQYDKVDLNIEITDITFDRINGIIESQTVNDSGEIAINSRSVIQSAKISDGHLKIRIDNRIGGEADVNLFMKELTLGGAPLERSFHVLPGLNQEIIDLNDFLVEPDLDEQKLTYHTTTVTAPGLQADYNLLDSIKVSIDVSKMTFSEVSGYIHQDAIEKNDIITLDNETKVETARFKSGKMRLIIRNYIGTVANVIFSVDEIRANGQSLVESIPILDSADPETTLIDLQGAELNLPLNNQEIHYSSVVSIDSTVLMNLSLEDSIQIDVDLYDLSFEEVAGLISPVDVEIDTIEQEITTLPEELNGIEFANVDITFDFDTNIGVPVLLTLTLKSENSDGDTAVTSISGWDITDSSLVKMTDVEQLINIKPDRIKAYGTASVGSSEIPGSVATDQYVSGRMYISAPLELIITEDAKIEQDPKKAEAPVPEEVKSMLVWADTENQFEFGASVNVLAARDTLHFLEDSQTKPDTLLNLELKPQSTILDSFHLDNYLTSLLHDTIYIKTVAHLLGNEEGTPSRFLSTDSLKVRLYGTFKYYLDLASSEDSTSNGGAK